MAKPLQPTKNQLKRFDVACALLADLSREGFPIYLANDSMHLMGGPTHDRRGNPLIENSVAYCLIPGAGGGAW